MHQLLIQSKNNQIFQNLLPILMNYVEVIYPLLIYILFLMNSINIINNKNN